MLYFAIVQKRRKEEMKGDGRKWVCKEWEILCFSIGFMGFCWVDGIHVSSAKCNSVRKPHRILPDTPGDLTSASKYFQTLPDPPGAKLSALRVCKSILRCSWKHLQLWRCIQDAPSRIVKFWSSWDLCADLRETSREAETAAQLYGILRERPRPLRSSAGDNLDAVFSQQWFLHNHNAFRLIKFIFVTFTRFATS